MADVLGDLETLSRAGVLGNLSDAQLLDRFLGRRGKDAEDAFEVLVRRHGPMVLSVCGKVMGNTHDAQDAFQATFFVLAARAASIRRPDALATWLLGVAQRVAVRSRANGARRRLYEGLAAEAKGGRDEKPPEGWPELHEEIARLPERYRQPVLLCYLDGLSTQAAAVRLGCPHGTVLSRLARARGRLRAGLSRRGLAAPTCLPVAGLSPEGTRAAITANLLEATVRASLGFAKQPASAAPSSTAAVSLARGVLYTMMSTKLKILGLAAVACIVTVGRPTYLCPPSWHVWPDIKSGGSGFASRRPSFRPGSHGGQAAGRSGSVGPVECEFAKGVAGLTGEPGGTSCRSNWKCDLQGPAEQNSDGKVDRFGAGSKKFVYSSRPLDHRDHGAWR